ncbi:hypothetical protein [Paenibacillus albidus]|nr:hypothetical protein [Paenibacillus albidus]
MQGDQLQQSHGNALAHHKSLYGLKRFLDTLPVVFVRYGSSG